MSTFIHVGDTHIGCKLYNLPQLEQDVREAFVAAVDKAIALSIDYFIVSGDLYDHNKPTPEMVDFVSMQVDRMTTKGIIVLGQNGDHDAAIDGVAWAGVTGMQPINRAGFFGVPYNNDPSVVLEQIKSNPASHDVEWLFLHGMVPQLWPFCEDKKTLPMDVELLKNYPNLKGILLSDIHKPICGKLALNSKNIPMEYVGSLGVTAADEVEGKKGIHYYDGKKLNRILFPPKREFIRVDFTKEDSKVIVPVVNPAIKPVIIVSYSKATRERLKELTPLYEVGHVVRNYVSIKKQGDVEQTTIRSEMKCGDKSTDVLRSILTDNTQFDLATALLASHDPRSILEEFKKVSL